MITKKMQEKRPIIIGIGGASASGKTCFTKNLENYLNQETKRALVIPIDMFYKNLDINIDRSTYNFDLPNCIEISTLINLIKLLKENIIDFINLPIYNFRTCRRDGYETIKIKNYNIFIIEGIFAFLPELFELYDFSVYIELDINETLERRIERDKKYRNISNETTLNTFYSNVLPNFKQNIEPYKSNSSCIIAGNIRFREQLNIFNKHYKL